MELRNSTPYPAGWLVVLDPKGAEQLVLVLKATYQISGSGKLTLAEDQEPLRPADEYYGEPGKSSIRLEAELGPAKPATDVVLLGSGVAPRRGTRSMDVSLRVGPLSKRVRVFGERRWRRFLWWRWISSPRSFDSVPLTYENAFGGSDSTPRNLRHRDREPRNPVGRGFRAKRSRMKWSGTPLPNIEDPRQRLKRPGQRVAPAGFGFVGRDWQPRLGYAGTYDQKWQEERMPLLPLDFDERFHNAATPDLVAEGHLSGGEQVEVQGCARPSKLRFELPRLRPTAEVRIAGRSEALALKLDTVLVDTENMLLRLVWKGWLRVHQELPLLKQMIVRVEGEA